ncbi:hypothetical protein [Streptomyces sp. NPDC020681]|uniref:hypothetical protein n=1 Tax=Streptomyces sp. NPDC020681 TaxID=3365083 RepID=UPI0037B6663B
MDESGVGERVCAELGLGGGAGGEVGADQAEGEVVDAGDDGGGGGGEEVGEAGDVGDVGVVGLGGCGPGFRPGVGCLACGAGCGGEELPEEGGGGDLGVTAWGESVVGEPIGLLDRGCGEEGVCGGEVGRRDVLGEPVDEFLGGVGDAEVEVRGVEGVDPRLSRGVEGVGGDVCRRGDGGRCGRCGSGGLGDDAGEFVGGVAEEWPAVVRGEVGVGGIG